MNELTDKIAELKAQYPTLQTGNEEEGYVQMEAKEYEATIKQWAENLIANPIQPPIWER